MQLDRVVEGATRRTLLLLPSLSPRRVRYAIRSFAPKSRASFRQALAPRRSLVLPRQAKHGAIMAQTYFRHKSQTSGYKDGLALSLRQIGHRCDPCLLHPSQVLGYNTGSAVRAFF